MLVFLLSLVVDWRTLVFRLSGFYTVYAYVYRDRERQMNG